MVLGVRRLAILLVLLAVTPLTSAAAPAPTPDQKLVAGLQGGIAASRSALSQLKPPGVTPERVERARRQLARAFDRLKEASKAVPTAVGALATPEVRNGLSIAVDATSSAAGALSNRLYDYARLRLIEALDAATGALDAFGVPLRKDFRSFAVFRDVSMIYGFEDYMSVNARVRAPVKKIVIGLADRATANAEEGRGSRTEPSLAISKLTLYSIQEPSGSFTSGWCRIVTGVIRCNLDAAMRVEEIFAVSFGPRMPSGTKLLLKFWSTKG